MYASTEVNQGRLQASFQQNLNRKTSLEREQLEKRFELDEIAKAVTK